MKKINIVIDEQKDLKKLINEICFKISSLDSSSEINLTCSLMFGMSKIYTKKGSLRTNIKSCENSSELTKLRNILEDGGHRIVNVDYKKKNKLYAIKDGKGVSNYIVNSWDECKKYTQGYNAVYKSFYTIEECNNYFNVVDPEKVKEVAAKAMESKKNKKANNNIIKISLSEEMYLDLEKKSKEVGLSKEHLIRFALNNYLY